MKNLIGNSENVKNAFAVVGFAFFLLVIYLYVVDPNFGE